MAAVIAVPLAKRLGLGSVLGYLVAGVVIGPVIGLVGQETTTLQHFAEFGVVMMLFLVGMELDPKSLWAMRVRLLGLGGLQVALTAAAECLLGAAPPGHCGDSHAGHHPAAGRARHLPQWQRGGTAASAWLSTCRAGPMGWCWDCSSLPWARESISAFWRSPGISSCFSPWR
ncbi:putative TrkA family protein [Marinobacter algicola DG893]|uniref:Putative TrkA family protein n=1 Tax=Marinobacter algicola DG893 TaxID=443152 RepID=A6EZQ0_9GAMM|nr:putative TrkA family protein [Marinobacter algicola DG893]